MPAHAAEPVSFVMLEGGWSGAGGTPGAVARFALSPTMAGESRASGTLGEAGAAGVEVGRILAAPGGSLRLGLALSGYGGRRAQSDVAFAAAAAIRDGGGRVTASGRASATAELRSRSMMIRATYEANGGVFGRPGGSPGGAAFPWIGLGIGLAETRVAAHDIAYSADLTLRAPGERAAASISDATQTVAAARALSPAWEISAGIAAEARPGWVVSLGLRYADLGSYRLGGQDGPALLGLDGQRLEIGFGGQSRRLQVGALMLGLRHEF